jgi:polyisoprenoid-binding protein YceI
MKKVFCISLLLIVALTAYNQIFITRNGNVSFYSHTPLEDIKAENNEAVSVLNAGTGDIEFKIAIKSFHFPKTAMEEHFNDDYMAFGKFAKADFKEKITNISSANFLKEGIYNVSVSGNLTIKDVTKPVSSNGTITVKNGIVTAAASFKVQRRDYNVIGESFVQKKIAEEIEINVNCQYDKQ